MNCYGDYGIVEVKEKELLQIKEIPPKLTVI